MRSLKREWLPSVLAVLLGFCAVFGSIPLSAYAQQDEAHDFIDYKLARDDWTITYNDNGTYNVTIDVGLDQSLQEGDVCFAMLWRCGTNIREDQTEIRGGEREFTIRAENVPDTAEVHFCFVIEQNFKGPPGGTYWQYHPYASSNYPRQATWELHEEPIRFPVKKIWADGEEKHSGDTVDLVLQENGSDTSYKVTLSKDNDWEGEFKHVPYVRWTYPYIPPKPISMDNADTPVRAATTPCSYDREGLEIPLDPRGKYTVVETSDTPGYIATYEFTEPAKPAKPGWMQTGSAPAVRAVFESDRNKVFDIQNGIVEYMQEAESQRLVLNGDHTLVCKQEKLNGSQFPLYIMIGFEETPKRMEHTTFIKWILTTI